MAINPRDKEVSLDLARELLIAISESIPENLLNPKSGEEHLYSNGHVDATLTNGDIEEELRSELISISYALSPETIALPARID